ncbi:MAG: tRNA uridine-5-carboxymethylaminomethyl(34) synthesis GTPase MnmE [Chlamydiia bacterium]|nr:tRNA uridine-5-carboxymethylaminomethyl(34) synthesis GTPase MnmE [Chlamydiia bacterium]
MSHFVYTPFDLEDTIAAIATPPGEGGVAIVRLSGKRAREIANTLFSGNVLNYSTHTVHLGWVLDVQGHRIDEALLLVMLGKKSFTGEDTIEFQCHGGFYASKKILEALIEAGARLAKPGEFALRAFLAGKIDLSQAEAIGQLIGAKNEHAFSAASSQLAGNLSIKITSFQQNLTKIGAILEAWVDFPEEGLEFATLETLLEEIYPICGAVKELIATFENGRKISCGISCALIGPPNVGKSSLMNRLLGKERAIVASIPGTTRDFLEEDLMLGGVNFRLIDTAGIRSGSDEVEREGIFRAKQALKEADLVLLVLDASDPPEKEFIENLPCERTLLIWNKIDLAKPPMLSSSFAKVVEISAKEGWGIKTLENAIYDFVWKGSLPTKEEVVITQLRHKEALVEVQTALSEVIRGLEEKISPELVALEMRTCLKSLGKIMGTDVTEGLLNSIFSQFCIGK